MSKITLRQLGIIFVYAVPVGTVILTVVAKLWFGIQNNFAIMFGVMLISGAVIAALLVLSNRVMERSE